MINCKLDHRHSCATIIPRRAILTAIHDLFYSIKRVLRRHRYEKEAYGEG